MSDQYIQLPTGSNLDFISCLKFSPFDNQLLAASWDHQVLLYDITNLEDVDRRPTSSTKLESPSIVLSVAYGSNASSTFLGCQDGIIRHVDYENLKISGGGNATDGISSGINNLLTIPGKDNLIVATSINGTVQYIDTRIEKPIHTRPSPNTLGNENYKIFRADTTNQYLALAMSGRRIEVYDHRNWNQPYQIRESGLKYQACDLRCFPSGEGYALSSIDGRVSMEYFDNSPEVQAQKFAFKCHRLTNKRLQQDYVYPVNALCFHRNAPMLFTGGSDGFVCLWNWHKRKRMKQYPKFDNPQSVVKLDLNFNQQLLAIATCDDSFKNKAHLAAGGAIPEAVGSKIWIKSLSTTEWSTKRQ